jgi:hypothetical protein
MVAVVAGIAAASVVSPTTAAEQPAAGRDELPAGSIDTGAPAGDPRGGPPWAVRIYDAQSSRRCIVAGRTDATAFGPIDAKGEIYDTGAVTSGSCANPLEDPRQVAVARYADSGGDGPRTVLYGIVDATVKTVDVDAPGVDGPVAVDADRTFIVVREGLWPDGSVNVTFTLSDGSTRSYRL